MMRHMGPRQVMVAENAVTIPAIVLLTLLADGSYLEGAIKLTTGGGGGHGMETVDATLFCDVVQDTSRF